MNTPPPLPGPLAPYTPLQSPTAIRTLGWLLIFIGPLLCAGMVALTTYIVPVVNAPTVPGSLPRYTGTHAQTVFMFALFGLLFIFGSLSLAIGVYQVRHGRRSVPLVVLFALVLVAVVAAGCIIVAGVPKP